MAPVAVLCAGATIGLLINDHGVRWWADLAIGVGIWLVFVVGILVLVVVHRRP